ncbi:hypothetical protein T459_25116 [Capsicum annuum]|uniref:Uncharacterized protein n=1 Tax=Capsicum annuum TaxID=4072 RepID=A0A2G2YJT4_CAPAN|nr:hypothetical protein T459_25116 [Capsicum annuum]
MREMIEDRIKIDRIASFAILKVTTQAIQKGSGSVGGKKNEEDVATIVAGQRARSRRLCRCYPQSSAQVHIQALYNHSNNPLYSIPPYSYPVYSSQPYVQRSNYPQWRAPTLQSHPSTPQTYQSPSRLNFLSKSNNEMRQKLRDSFTPIGESYDHSIEDYRALKREIEKMIQDK